MPDGPGTRGLDAFRYQTRAGSAPRRGTSSPRVGATRAPVHHRLRLVQPRSTSGHRYLVRRLVQPPGDLPRRGRAPKLCQRGRQLAELRPGRTVKRQQPARPKCRGSSRTWRLHWRSERRARPPAVGGTAAVGRLRDRPRVARHTCVHPCERRAIEQGKGALRGPGARSRSTRSRPRRGARHGRAASSTTGPLRRDRPSEREGGGSRSGLLGPRERETC